MAEVLALEAAALPPFTEVRPCNRHPRMDARKARGVALAFHDRVRSDAPTSKKDMPAFAGMSFGSNRNGRYLPKSILYSSQYERP